MVLEFELEPCARRLVILPLVEHLVNVSDERDEAEEVLTEELFARFRPAFSEEAAVGGQRNRTVFEFGELEDVQGRGNRENIIDAMVRSDW